MNAILKIVNLPDSKATESLGAALSAMTKPGDIICLRGDLGAGKTTLARGFIHALAGAQDVPSPTYTLVQTYDAPDFGIWHFDLYRLESEGDVWELGIEEALEDGVCLIEWPERIENLLSGGELNLNIKFTDKGRTAEISGTQLWGKYLARL